ncbi:MAG: hypothetical protein ABIQ35_05085 [Verrucomicrobiota bacterium]
MKHQILSWLATGSFALFALSSISAFAESGPVAAQSPAPISYGVSEVLKLAQAKLGDEIIVSYIQNKGQSYADLTATDIVYLHEHGVSPRVVTAMLAQRPPLSEPTQVAAPQAVVPPARAIASEPTSAIAPVRYAPPAVEYVQSSPTVIVMRDSSPRLIDYGIYPRYSYYPSYGYYGYPRASFSFGFGGGYYGGYHSGGYHGYGGGSHGHGGGHHR